MDDPDDLTGPQREALRLLPGEADVPPGLEDRVVGELRVRGLLGTTASRAWLPRLAAAAAFFVAGLGVGLQASHAPTPRAEASPLYLLLLYGGPGFVEGAPADEAARVAEYGAWAGGLRREGRLVSAEKLRDGGRLLEGAATLAAGAGPQGFFLVRARDLAEAEAIARACPHLRHGGRVAVQAVEPTGG